MLPLPPEQIIPKGEKQVPSVLCMAQCIFQAPIDAKKV